MNTNARSLAKIPIRVGARQKTNERVPGWFLADESQMDQIRPSCSIGSDGSLSPADAGDGGVGPNPNLSRIGQICKLRWVALIALGQGVGRITSGSSRWSMGAIHRITGRLLFVTGASGVGKTSTLRLFEQHNPDILVRYFDSFVPCLEEMIEEYGSGEAWQRHKTIEWIGRIKHQALHHASVILDIQTRQTFVDEACDLAGISDYRIVLFDCADGAREQRLIARGHPELANSQMAAWASYLRAQALMRSDPIIDATGLTIEDAVNELKAIARQTFGSGTSARSRLRVVRRPP